jgi:DNA-binding NtrC family response regulator
LHFSFFSEPEMAASFLIVDEDRNHREALAIALRLDGHEVVVEQGAEDGRARLAARHFDCVVVDAWLAGADALLEAAARLGILAVATGAYPELLRAAAVRHPHAAALAKPFRAVELTARLGPPAPRPRDGRSGAAPRPTGP